jgi:hypothetical protein
MTTPIKSKDTKVNKHYDKPKNPVDNNIGTPIFKVTGNISNLGIQSIVHDRGILQITFNNQTRCSVFVQRNNKSSLQKLCNDIRNKLEKKLENIIDDPKVIDKGLSDIESQIISYRDEIFALSNSFSDINTNHPNTDFNTKFYEDVEKLRSQFQEASEPYKEWQTKVAEKYEKLETIFKKHYPEAWIFMEFCLSIKSIMNIMGITLPFMGVLVAAPSSLKTMVIQLFRKYPSTFYTDSFTSSSLVSHNASLSEEQLQKIDMLPKMKNNLVLTPELAPLITGNEDELQKVLGIITRVLDGHGLENDSGAHGHRKYSDTMFVWLGAVVEIPPRVWKVLGSLGHKIYFLRPPLAKKTVADLKKIAKSNNFSAINKEIEVALLDYLKTFDAAPNVEGKVRIDDDIVKIRWNEEMEEGQDEAIECIAQLAKLLAPLRGVVYVSPSKSFTRKINNGQGDGSSSNIEQQQKQQLPLQQDGQDYDTDIPTIEDPSRAVVILRNLAIGHALSQGRDSLTLKDVPIVIKVGLSTAQVRRVRILDQLLKSENGVLTTSQICTQLGISQPAVTKTMREFDALKIGELSAVSNYDNSELQIKLSSEFDWFGSEEFQRLKEGFIPCEDNNKKNNLTDPDKEEKDSSTDNKHVEVGLESHDNNTGCHTFQDNLPSETEEKNEGGKDENNNSCQKIISEQDCKLLLQTQENPTSKKDDTSLWGSNSLEPVTLSHSTTDECEVEGEQQSPYHIPTLIKENNGIKNVAFKEILKVIRSKQGSAISVNFAIECACANSEAVKNYLNGKMTSRENRDVRDIVSNIVRHYNIDVIKQKPQIVVKWSENKDDSLTNMEEDQFP